VARSFDVRYDEHRAPTRRCLYARRRRGLIHADRIVAFDPATILRDLARKIVVARRSPYLFPSLGQRPGFAGCCHG